MKLSAFSVLLAAISVFIAAVPSVCRAAKIVVLYPVGSKSHLISVMPIVDELAQRGHDITLVTSFKVPISDSMRLIFLDDLAAKLDAFSPDWFAMSNEGPTQIFTMMGHLKSMFIDGYECLTSNREFRSLIDKKDIDLFIVDALFSDFTFPIIDRLKVPFVLHSSGTGVPFILQPAGMSMNYASTPTVMTDFDDQMTFMQRLINTVSSELAYSVMDIFLIRSLEERIRKDTPDIRPLAELRREASLLLLNSHPATDWPRSFHPNVIPLGAMHTRKAKPLQEVN